MKSESSPKPRVRSAAQVQAAARAGQLKQRLVRSFVILAVLAVAAGLAWIALRSRVLHYEPLPK
jgi:hypothetical protein